MPLVRQIKVGKHNTGIVGLDNVLKEIAGYGVMGSPAPGINRKVKYAGSVPPETKLKKWILKATAELKRQQDA